LWRYERILKSVPNEFSLYVSRHKIPAPPDLAQWMRERGEMNSMLDDHDQIEKGFALRGVWGGRIKFRTHALCRLLHVEPFAYIYSKHNHDT
jgi:hypothetical protein